jgi:hypothetical protein
MKHLIRYNESKESDRGDIIQKIFEDIKLEFIEFEDGSNSDLNIIIADMENKHGDAIDFIQKLHNLDFKNALKYLGMTPGRPPMVDPKQQRKRELLADFEQWRRDKYNDACDFYNDIWHVLRACKDMEEISQHAPMIHQLSQIENEILVLSEGNHAEQYELYSAGI